MYDPQILRRAEERLARARQQNEARQQANRTAAYAESPRLAEIDRTLRATAGQIVAAAFRRGTDPGPALRALRNENMALQEERARLLAAQGLAPDALDERPLCAKCGDTGWVGASMCVCLRELCAEEQLRALSLLLDLKTESFDTFRWDYYSDEPWPGRGISPRENMELNYELCANYARKFGRFPLKNLFLTGAPGLGKTFLSACIARTVSEEGFSVVYDTAQHVFSRFEAERFTREEAAGADTARCLSCDLLILDDLGSEFTSPFTQTALYELINARLTAGRCTVISSNLSMDDVRRRYTPQIASRMEGEYREVEFFGRDIRLLRKRDGLEP